MSSDMKFTMMGFLSGIATFFTSVCIMGQAFGTIWGYIACLPAGCSLVVIGLAISELWQLLKK